MCVCRCTEVEEKGTDRAETSSSSLSEYPLHLPFWGQILVSVAELLQIYVTVSSNGSKMQIQGVGVVITF